MRRIYVCIWTVFIKQKTKFIDNRLNFSLLFYSNPSAFKEILQVQITLWPSPACRKWLKKNNNAENFRQTPNILLKILLFESVLLLFFLVFTWIYVLICHGQQVMVIKKLILTWEISPLGRIFLWVKDHKWIHEYIILSIYYAHPEVVCFCYSANDLLVKVSQ